MFAAAVVMLLFLDGIDKVVRFSHVGIRIALVSAFFYSVDIVLKRKITQKLSNGFILFWSYVFVSPIYLAVCYFKGLTFVFDIKLLFYSWVGLVTMLLCFQALRNRKLDPSIFTMILSFSIVFNSIVNSISTGVLPSPLFMLIAFQIICGLAMIINYDLLLKIIYDARQSVIAAYRYIELKIYPGFSKLYDSLAYIHSIGTQHNDHELYDFLNRYKHKLSGELLLIADLLRRNDYYYDQIIHVLQWYRKGDFIDMAAIERELQSILTLLVRIPAEQAIHALSFMREGKLKMPAINEVIGLFMDSDGVLGCCCLEKGIDPCLNLCL